jgi:heme exporter protein C
MEMHMTDVAATQSRFASLANPTRFIALAGMILPWLAALTALCLAAGVYMSFNTEGDYQQGETVRIMYVHVPAAWLSMMCYTIMAISALGTLVWRHPLADVAAKSAAPLGAAFTFLALVTGSLWGKPMWGTWWVWDARLTSVFVLFLMYLGLIAFNKAMDDPGRAARVSAIMILVGFVNIPIIKFSVEWWNTLHQPASVIRMDGPTIDPEFLYPLATMAAAFTLLFFTLHLMAMRNEIWRRRISVMRRHAARAAQAGE